MHLTSAMRCTLFLMILYPSRVAPKIHARHIVRSPTAVLDPAPSVDYKVLTVFHITCRQSLWRKCSDLWQVAAVCKPGSCCLQDNRRTNTAVKRPAYTRHALLPCLHLQTWLQCQANTRTCKQAGDCTQCVRSSVHLRCWTQSTLLV